MKRVYFIRHGQSEWNVADRICGMTDIPLTDEGRAQADRAGALFVSRGLRADRILYSPLSRAAETAVRVSRVTGLPARADERLREQHFGRWEGTSPRNSAAFTRAKQQFVCSFSGGESMLRLAQRVYNLLDELRGDDSCEACILVAHNGIARVVHSYFFDMTNEEYAAFGAGNCEILTYEFAAGRGSDPHA